MSESRPSRQIREQALERLFQTESTALREAELALTKQQLTSAVYEPFRELIRHYRRLLRQALKVTAVSDASQLQLRQTSRELADAVDRVQQLNAQLRVLQEEKDEIFAMAVHDMKSPLSGVFGLASLLTENTPDVDPRQAGRDILQLTGTMLDMVNDLVEVYRLESGEVHFEPLAVKPVDIVSLLSSTYLPLARRKHIDLKFRHESPIETVLVDPAALERLGGNLISNAIKFSPIGTSVEVALIITPDRLRLSVADHGPGISAADQKKLFVKFSRLSARPTGGESTSGLGLAIVKRLALALGGDVTCESTLGAGARFEINLPHAPAPAA